MRGAAGVALVALSAAGPAVSADVSGTVQDALTSEPIPAVFIEARSGVATQSAADGTFVIRNLATGPCTLRFRHVAYHPDSVHVLLPQGGDPLVVRLSPRVFELPPVRIRVDAIQPAPADVTITPRQVAGSAGNLMNDPLRTIQSLPAAAPSGQDFSSGLVIRAGDEEELHVYVDGFPMPYASHVGGFAPVVSNDFIDKVELYPGAAPLRYRGHLSGVIRTTTAEPDSSWYFGHYDVASMGAGLARVLGPGTSVLASAQTSYFTLPAYRQVGVDERAFRDAFVRARYEESERRWSALLLATDDSETGNASNGVRPRRDISSQLVGLRLRGGTGRVRYEVSPRYVAFRNRDEIVGGGQAWEHRVEDGTLGGEVRLLEKRAALVIGAEMSNTRYEGAHGAASSRTLSGFVETTSRLPLAGLFTVGLGGAREPWTRGAEREYHASLRFGSQDGALIEVAGRRSHQSPFVFREERYFAAIRIDPGDLLAAYEPSWESAPAIRVDQWTLGSRLPLPGSFSLSGTVYTRDYAHLLTWSWDDVFDPVSARSDGSGQADGFEIVLRRDAPGRISGELSRSRARITKREGTLVEGRPGDFDMPDAWRLQLHFPFSPDAGLSLSWRDVAGRPYTDVARSDQMRPEDVNRQRLPRFRRLDVKLHWAIVRERSEVTVFLDILNLRNDGRVTDYRSIERTPGEFVGYERSGTALTPIVGASVRFW